MSLAPLPLTGIVVLDLSRVLAGPYCGLMLADMGADVIKIESIEGGDDSRTFTEPSYKDQSIYFLTINRNKRSVALDLKHPDAKSALLRLVDKADVVVENFRTGVMERLGLGYETLRARRPKLVYCAISGYGRSGPNVDVPGYDPVAQAESGLMSMIGDPDGDPMRVGASIIDLVTGLYASQAISAALRHVAAGGDGRLIEATLHETGLSLLANFAGIGLMTGRCPTRTGNTNQVVQPAGVYDASDGPFMMTIVNDAQFRSLCSSVLANPSLATDPRFERNSARLANGPELRRILGEAFRTSTRADWVERLRRAGVPAGSIATVAEALRSEIVAARGTVREVEHSTVGRYPVLRAPARLHETEPLPARGAPLLGEHTREILRDVAGLSEAEIRALEVAGAARSASRE